MLAQALPAKLVGFLLCAFQGLIIPLLFAIALRLLPAASTFRTGIALVLTLVGATGAMTLIQYGATFHDNTLSVLVLTALLLVLIAHDRAEAGRPIETPIVLGALLTGVASDLPHLHPDGRPTVNATSSTDYTVTIPVRSPADDTAARSTFQRWLWYAARRAGLRLDGLDDDFNTTARRAAALRKIAPILRANSSELEMLLPQVKVTRYAADEVMDQMALIFSFRVEDVRPLLQAA